MLFRKKNKNEELLQYAIKFFEEENGEIDLAYYALMEKFPYTPPINKFIEWLRLRGYNRDVTKDEAYQVLNKALRIKLTEKSSMR